MPGKYGPVNAMKAALTEQLHIDLRSHQIHLSMDGGDMVLEGVVETIACKKRALLTAMGLEGVSGVIDRLKVRPSSTMSDDEIKKHFDDAVCAEPTFRGMEIRAEVDGGVIDLEGVAPSLCHKRLAGVMAWWVPGSADVINSLDVSPPEEDNDDEITEALRLVLEKDGLVNAGELSVATRSWVVTLRGVAGSEAEKDAAEDDAWYVWGVNDVVNEIRVIASGGKQD